MQSYNAPLKQKKTVDQGPLVHLVYDELLTIDASTFRYRIWFGQDRLTVVLIDGVEGSPPSWYSQDIATKIFNTHIARVKKDRKAPFIYIERYKDSLGRSYLSSAEFDRVDDRGSVKFWNTRLKSVDDKVLMTLISNAAEAA